MGTQMITKKAREWDEIRARLAERNKPELPPLTFSGIPRDYWREEVRLECAVSLARLRSICAERGADYDKTIAGLKGG